MNALTRWNPFAEMDDLQQRLSSVFDLAPARTPYTRNGDDPMTPAAQWAPLVDITEDDHEYLIKVELPEVKKNDVNVTVENGTLAVSGERKFKQEEKGRKYHRIERVYGSFRRTFSLPSDADPNQVKAEFNDGLLKIHLIKSESARPKQIEIKVG